MSKYKKLHDAISFNDLKALKTLVQQGADVNAVYQQETAFTWAAQCKRFKCINLIMSSKKFNPNAGNQFDRTPLFMAAKLNRPELVRLLIEMGARINDGDIRGVTPLGACGWYDSEECAEILIQHGANIDQPDIVGQTPLYRACSNVSKKVVQVLLDHCCDVNLTTCDRKTPLMAALPTVNNLNAGKTLTNMISICRLLTSNGCDINAQDENGRAALHHTIESNDIYGMCFLAACGCDSEMKDSTGYTAFQTAILPRRPRYEIAKYLLHFGADGGSEMLNPNEQDSPTILPLFLLMNSRPNRAMDADAKWSRTLLLRSLSYAINPNTIKCHQSINVPIYLRKENLNFHETTELEIIKLLKRRDIPYSLQNLARLKIRQVIGNKSCVAKIDSLPLCTAMKKDLNLGLSTTFPLLELVSQLHVAIRDGHNGTVEKLLDKGTCTTILLKNKNALTLAIEVGNTEATMMILRTKLSGNDRSFSRALTPSHESALHIAAKHGRSDIVKEVIDLGCDVNAKSITGSTPLHEAVLGGHFKTAAILIKHGADVAIYGQGVPILHLTAASGSKEVTELLLSGGWDVNATDVFGNTPLHVAASKGTEYLYRNISLPALYSDKTSAVVDSIHMMMSLSGPAYTKKMSGHLETVKFLIKAGSDVTRLNSQSKSPLVNAEYIEDAAIIKALRKAS